jgi:hypothetical protein
VGGVKKEDLARTLLLLNQGFGPAFRKRLGSGESSFQAVPAVISRHWYSTYREMAAHRSASEEEPLLMMKLPGRTWTNGDWHFSILEGSSRARTGVEIIRSEFVNDRVR